MDRAEATSPRVSWLLAATPVMVLLWGRIVHATDTALAAGEAQRT